MKEPDYTETSEVVSMNREVGCGLSPRGTRQDLFSLPSNMVIYRVL